MFSSSVAFRCDCRFDFQICCSTVSIDCSMADRLTVARDHKKIRSHFTYSDHPNGQASDAEGSAQTKSHWYL